MHKGLRPIIHEIAAQRSELFHWAPVFIGLGIAVTFHFGWIIGVLIVCVSLGLFFLYVAVIGLSDSPFLPPLIMAFCIALGAIAAVTRTYTSWGPSLSYPYSGLAVGQVVLVDRSAGDNMRLTLENVTLGPIPIEKTPHRIRVSFAADQGFDRPRVGDTIAAKVYISAPRGPAEPGGFDFRRHAYFLGLGAVGYGRHGFEIRETAKAGQWSHVFPSMQFWVSQLIENTLPTDTQGVARAIIAGDRYGVTQETAEQLRRSNLAHLLAISGLHMGLLTTLVFFGLRLVFVVMPLAPIALRAKAFAALGAICAGAIYLGISGGNVATQRAFVMIAAFYSAAILNRQIISFRALAMAAMVILMFRPEALYSPGFQMSFAATLALVFVFQSVVIPRTHGRVFGSVIGAFLSSFVAGLATAPIAAIHFNQISHVGLVANVLAVPVMSAVVAPAAIIGLVLAPFGAEWGGFWAVDHGLRWILYVAKVAASFDFAVSYTVTPLWWGVGCLVFGALLIALWRGPFGRCFGIGLLCVSLASWFLADRPDVLISDTARLVGVLTPKGRAISKPKGDRFTAEIWMENDGIRHSQAQAYQLWQDHISGVIHIWSKRDAGKTVSCTANQIIVAAVDIHAKGPCQVFDADFLTSAGSTAMWRDPNGSIRKIVTSNAAVPRYMWRDTQPPFRWLAPVFFDQ